MSKDKTTTIFLSYARGDDEPFVRRLYDDLTAHGFKVWFDRVSMPSRTLTFHQEIRDAVAAHDRLLLVIGPKAVASEYVRQEWQFAWFEAEKVVTPILRLGDYPLAIDELKLVHAEDFRNDADYALHLKELVRILNEPPPPMGKLIAVPSLPAHYLSRTDRLIPLRDAVRSGLDSPAPFGGMTARQQFHGIAGASKHVGMHGMGGIGKSVLANLLARDRKIREAFPDGIVWVGLGSVPVVADLMHRVHVDFGGDGAFVTEHEGKAKLKDLLSDKAVLLVLDDAWRRQDIEAFDILGPRCRALITTRDAGLLTSVGGTQHLVELLTDDEALRLLALAVGKELDELPAEARMVIKQCGRLPLAVSLAGGMVAAGMSWTNLLTAFDRHKLEFFKDEHRPEQHQSLWKMIEMSVRALGAAEQMRLVELGVFPEDEAVPEKAVATLWQHTGHLDDLDTPQLLVKLKQRSLVQFSAGEQGGVGVGRVSLHDLVHDYCLRRAQAEFGGDSVRDHRRLLDAYLAHCPSGWASGPDDGYYFENVTGHVILAGDVARMQQFLRSGFLETKARLRGDIAAMADARAMAEALAAAGERHWDDLVACAHVYCTFAERVRAAPDALEALARGGQIDQLTRALDVETDPRRRVALSLAAAALLREAGHTEHAEEFWCRGTALWAHATDDSTDKLVRGLWNAWVAPPASPPATGHVPEVGAVVAPATEPRRWISPIQSLLLALTSGERGVQLAVGYFCLTLSVLALIHPLFNGLGESKTGTLGAAWIAVVTTPIFLVTLAGGWLRRPNHPGIQRAMNGLLAGALHAQGIQRSWLVLRALRLHSLIPYPDVARPWKPLLSQLAVQEFRSDLAPSQAAIWLTTAAKLGEPVAEALFASTQATTVPWLTDVLRHVIRQHAYYAVCSESYRLVARLVQHVDDPILLLELLHGEPPGFFEFADGETTYTLLERNQQNILSTLSSEYLARSIIASARDRSRRRNLLRAVWSLVEPLVIVRVPLSPLERLWLPSLLLIVTIPLLVFLLVCLAIVVGIFAMYSTLALLSCRYNPYGLSASAEVGDTVTLRRRLLDRLVANLHWSCEYLRARHSLAVLIAQSVLRKEYVDLYNVPKSCIRRALKLLSCRRLLGRCEELLLHAMGSRPLIDMIDRLRESLRHVSTVPAPDSARDERDLLCIVPVRPARRSLQLTLLLFLAMSATFISAFVLQTSPGQAHGVVHLLVFGALVGVILCVQQHRSNPELDRDRKDITERGYSLIFPLLGGLSIALLYEAWLQRPEFREGSGTCESLAAMFELFGLVVGYPLVMANLVVPELIARWRGVGLLYPTRSHLAVRRATCIGLAVAVPLALALLATHCL